MALPRSPHYTFQDLGNGITAAIARPDGFAVCNSTIVALPEGGLVFDTGLTPESAKDLRNGSEQLLGRPPSVAVNSHRHLDHALGNSEFATVPIWGTRRTREVMLETHDQTMAELKREALERDIRELEGRRAEMRTDTARADLEFILHMNRALLESAGQARLIPPSQTFDTRVRLPGSRAIELVSFGSGHTEADALMLLSSEKVLVAGDLVCVGIQPSLGSGDPRHWLVVLDEIEKLRPERIVPGHGPVGKLEGVEETRGYVAGVLEAATASAQAPLPRAIRRWEGTISLEENLRFAREWVAAHDARH